MYTKKARGSSYYEKKSLNVGVDAVAIKLNKRKKEMRDNEWPTLKTKGQLELYPLAMR